MRKFYLLLLAVFIMVSTFAQTPAKVSYQAIIRDAVGALAIDKNIEITVIISRDGDQAIEVYRETHSTQTNTNGLVSLEIGSGVVEEGLFSSIDWKNGSYFIKTRTDIEGQTITSTSELLSVPYALHAKDASTVNGKEVQTEVPEEAVFTDHQTAVAVNIDAITKLDNVSNVQEALEVLQGTIDHSGDMKKTAYDTNEDGVIDNTATVNNLTVQASVPADALFTDSQTGSEVDLATAVDIDGDGTQETTVESALIKLNDLMKKLEEEIKASTSTRTLESGSESVAAGTYRPCLATHHNETNDLVSFVSGTEESFGSEEEQSNYCHYIYGSEPFVTNSYKIIETDFLKTTENPEQALSTSFIAASSDSKIQFTQPLLCQHAPTGKWGYVETREENNLCVFGLYFPKDDSTYALDRGASPEYDLYSPDTNPVEDKEHKYCGQVNAKTASHPGTVFFGGQYDPTKGTCHIVGQDNSEKELHDNFFVYSDAPIENYIYEALGAMYADQQIYDQFHSSSHPLIEKFVYTQGINVVSGSYQSMEYVRDMACYDSKHSYFSPVCHTEDNQGASIHVLDDLQRVSLTKVANRTDNPSFSGVGSTPDDRFSLKLSAYSLAENETSKEQIETYVTNLKETLNKSKTRRDHYLGELLGNDQININHKAIVIHELSKDQYHGEVLESGSVTMTEEVEVIVQDFELGAEALTLGAESEGIPILVNPNGEAQEEQVAKHLKEKIDRSIERLEEISTSTNFLPLVQEETHFQTDPNAVHRFIRETLENDPNAFPSYFAYNHPGIIMTGAQLGVRERIAIMMADLYPCPDILKDWNSNSIDLTKPERISRCMHNNQEEDQAGVGVQQGNGQGDDQGGQENGNDQGGDQQGNNQEGDGNDDPEQPQNLQQLAQELNINAEHLIRFLTYVLIIQHEFSDDFIDFTILLMRGIAAEGNVRAGFGNSFLTLEELQAVLRELVNLNEQQRVSMAAAIAAAVPPLEHNFTEQSARFFLDMLSQNLPHGELTIQVLEGVSNVNVVVHEPEQDHVFGLGNIQNVEAIGQNRVFISGDDGQQDFMLFPDNYDIRYIRGQFDNGLTMFNQQYTVIHANGVVYVGHFENDSYAPNPQPGNILTHSNVVYVYQQNINIDAFQNATLSGFFNNNVPMNNMFGILRVSDQEFKDIWLQNQVNYDNLGTFTGIRGQYGRFTYENGDVYIGHFEMVNNNMEFSPQVGDIYIRNGEEYNMENRDISEMIPNATLSGYFNNDNPMDITPVILRVGDQEFYGRWLQDQVDYYDLGTFTGIDGVYGRLTYENGDVYLGHFHFRNIFDIAVDPDVGDTYTRNGVEYHVENHDINEIIPNATLSGFFNNNVPMNITSVILRVGDQEFYGRWLQDQVNYYNLGIFTGIDGLYGRLTYENGDVYLGHFEMVNNNMEFSPQVGDIYIRNGEEYNMENRDISEIIPNATLSGYFNNDNPMDITPAILRVGDQVFNGRWLQDQVDYYDLGTFTGIDGVYGRLTYENEDVYFGHFHFPDFIDIALDLNIGDIYTRNGVEYHVENHDINEIIPNATLSGFFNNNVPMNMPGVLRVGDQQYRGDWIQDQVNYHNLGTFTGIDGVYGRLTYENGNVYIGHLGNNFLLNPQIGDTWTHDGMQYGYQQNVGIGNIFQGATLTGFFTEQNISLNNMPGILRVGNQDYRGEWIQGRVNYHNLGTFTGIDGVYGRLTYEDGDVYIGHFSDNPRVNPRIGDTYTRNVVYTYGIKNIWEIISHANLSGFFYNGVLLINGHIQTMLRTRVFFPDEYRGEWIKDKESYQGTGGIFTGIGGQNGYGRLIVNNVSYIGTWDEIRLQLQNNEQGQ